MDLAVVFTYEELKELWDKFRKYDKDKNHVLSRAELLHLVRAGIDNATDREVEWFLGMIDIVPGNKDAVRVDFPQYVRGMSEFARIGTQLIFGSKSAMDTLRSSLVTSGLMSLNIGSGTKRQGLDWKAVDRVYTQFMNADANSSGTISFDEMVAVFKKVVPQLAANEYSTEFNKIDTNHSGHVDFMEFLAWAERHCVPISLGRTRSTSKATPRWEPAVVPPSPSQGRRKPIQREKSKTFEMVKLRSRRYSLSKAQLPVAAPKELRADAFKAFAAMDENADGEISEEEFYNALTQVVGELDAAEKNRLYTLVDSDGSETISYDEFLYAVANNKQVSQMAQGIKHSYFASKFPWEIPHVELVVEAQVGEGNFGIVSKGKWHGTPVAIKRLKQQNLTEEVLDDFKKELAILAKLRHPNIVMFIGACTQPAHLFIITEYLPEGTVYHLLHKQIPPKRFSYHGTIQLALQVARGMNYLHHYKVIHRDLKSLNLLLDDNYICKLCDFGLSCLLPKSGKVKEQVGSPLWMAPEVLNDDPYTEKIDVYSFAICMWEVLTNQLPWENLTLNQLGRALHEGKRPEIPSHCDPIMTNLLQQCWATDPTKRPDFGKVVEELERIKTNNY